MQNYHSVADLVKAANSQNTTISQLVLADQAAAMEVPEDEILSQMKNNLEIMSRSAKEGLKPDIRSVSGLSGGDGYKMHKHAASNTIGGSFCAQAIALAIAIQEYNAAMGKIVAAPTAGACGILPAGVLSFMEARNLPENTAIMALITAGAIGMVIANRATISGAQGGCQAECGSAAAMTAGALVEMAQGSNEMVAHAVAIALKNQLGLVCDPVAGLVEVPCIKRNAGGIMIAIGAADMALAGIKSVIPADEVITAMGEIGAALPSALRETAQGGLATTPTGLAIKERIFGG
ncbi:MAG: L-serine ammonia-lyase, iron-sulfur-dependent, subunit alpha [Defluviitaleaceae bacterium]|nr:L-serine ammonia-lyase, iron-sulfur-dependent, subunit alpha [Defluviitaleaceae bacterium]